jgi:intein/homing endonuclease
MRIKLMAGKQRKLISNFKNRRNFTWFQFSKFLKVTQPALLEWRREKNLLPSEIYQKLDKEGVYTKHVISIKNNTWGQKKGGINSRYSSLKKIKIPKKSKELAELIGIILGDGNVHYYRSGKAATYMLRIAGDKRNDYDYITKFVFILIKSLFNVEPKIQKRIDNEILVVVHSKNLVNYLASLGLKPGNKIKNQVTIPDWVFNRRECLKACVRGLIDTDGSIYRTGKWSQICFKNHNLRLLSDFRKALIKLGYHASNITWNKVYISRKSDIHKFYKDVGFSNPKHIRRYRSIFSPVV